MTFPQLLARYENGAVSDHEFAVESLNHLDPAQPSIVLDALPVVILRHLRDWIEAYRPGKVLSVYGDRIPGPDQVEAARRWLETTPTELSRPALATIDHDPRLRDQPGAASPSVQAIR